MGDFYDPEHPTEPSHLDYNSEDNEAKNENSTNAGFSKAAAFKGLSSSRFLPKGTKTKVNLEEQGRQKVSFSFSFTKKTLHNRFLTPLANDRQNDTQNSPPTLSPAEQISKLKMEFAESTGATEELSPPKPKLELGKIHFKKHLLSVTSKLPAPLSPPPPPPPPPPPLRLPVPTSPVTLTPTASVEHIHSSAEPVVISATSAAILTLAASTLTEKILPFVPLQTVLTDELSLITAGAKKPPSVLATDPTGLDRNENSVVSVVEHPSTQRASEKADLSLPKDSSHIGKERKSLDGSQNVKPSPEKPSSKSKLSHPDAVVMGSESDGDSVKTSSSHRSHELKNVASREKDSKRSSVSLKSDDTGRYSSRAKSGKDEKHSSYPKSDKESRYSYSRPRSDRDRRRSRSRSRSQSRSRSDRGPGSSSTYSRSDRSHYYESDRRYHRSSPYKTRYSRSYADSRTRESSDSEDEPRRTHSRSSDSRRPSSSSHSSFHRDARTSSHSKYERDAKGEYSHDHLDRRGRTSSRTESYSKKPSELEAAKKGSPQKETYCKRGSSHSKSDSNANSSSRSHSSRALEPKHEHLNTSSSSSKREVEKTPLRSSVDKEEHKTVKKDEVCSVNVPVHEKTVLPDMQQTPSLPPLEVDNFQPSSISSPYVGHETSFSPDSSKETQTLIHAKCDDMQSESPDLMNLTGSPSEMYDFVTLSTTEETVLEAQDVIESSDCVNTLDIIVIEDSDELRTRDYNEIATISQPINTAENIEIKQPSSSSVRGQDSEAVVPSDPEESKSSTSVDKAEPVSIVESEDQQLFSNKTKDASLCCSSEKSDTSFGHADTPADESKCAEPVCTDDNCTVSTDGLTEPQMTTVDHPVSEKLNVSETLYNDNVGTIDVIYESSDLFSHLSNTVQIHACDLSVEEFPLIVETNNEVATPALEQTCFSHDNEINQKHVQHDLEVQPTPLVLNKESLTIAESPLIEQEPAERETFEETVLSEAVNQQPEVPKTSTGDTVSEDLEKFETHNLDVASEEVESGPPLQKCDSSRNSLESFSAINDYYSVTEESESDESDTEDSDSDDSSMPRNRLQSVVVIPKNSTITKGETSPSSRSHHESRRNSDYEADKTKPKQFHEGKTEHAEYKYTEQKRACYSLSNKLDERLEVTVPEQSKKQNQTLELDAHHQQSDGVVSTSQPEVTAHTNGGENNLFSSNITKALMVLSQSSHQQEGEMALPSHPNLNQPHQQQFPSSTGKPDSRQERAVYDHSQGSREFSRGDGFQATEDMSCLGWDFSQPEKPSSTYQQPDSSYTYFGYNYPPGCEVYDVSRSYRKDNGFWDPRLHNKAPEIIYDRTRGPVPDSVTNCYDEDDEDFHWEANREQNLSAQSDKSYNERQREACSVQAHEISSNSTKENVAPIEKREQPVKASGRSDLKDRGPPKKRRPEPESDTESDAEAREKKLKEAGLTELTTTKQERESFLCVMDDFRDSQHWKDYSKQGKMPHYFDLIEENVYLTERKKNKSHRDIKRMQCECPLLSKEERSQGDFACGEDCLNRLLMIECSSRCPNGGYCSNRRFQRKQHADVEVILTDQKGWGLRAGKDLKPNTFVLEYCGEVLDHKEFKARVKEYARSKNIHYYFMALKNDEIIDATQKGNCSRFMNHSCEPNCETQKWTVNGQLRVGFFTTRVVPAGSELTFDYQFQRYGKEAQKCFCGSTNCRGYLGGENRVSIRAAGGKMKKERSRKKDSVDGELEALLENGEGLSDKNQVLILSRLMVRIETLEQRLTCLKLIKNTQSQSCLKFFLECHGLSLLWIWMAELGDSREKTNNSLKLQLEIIKTLELLPIPNKNMLEESKILPIIQRWAQTKTAIPQFSEGDGYSSENTSRAHTPLNTPINTPDPTAKLSIETDGETPKKLVFRRLKIISENSMDSAVSDVASEVEIKEAPEKAEAQPTEELKDAQLPKQQEPQEEGKAEEMTQTKSVDPPASEEQQLPEQELSAPKMEPDPPPDVGKAQAAETEAPEAEAKESNGPKVEETSAMETPSQDEEEGVSDVESERSQEQVDKMLDMGDLAIKLLEAWKDLKEVYRIPKKSQAEKENNDRWRDSSGFGYLTPNPKTPSQGRERESERLSQRKRRQSPSPPSFAYERGSKRGEDSRYDTPVSSQKKGRLQDRNKLSTEERRKLFEQEVAQREAQKQQQQQQLQQQQQQQQQLQQQQQQQQQQQLQQQQQQQQQLQQQQQQLQQQQQMQNLGITSPIPYESLPYGAQLPPPFITYPQGYPHQNFILDPTNPNAGKVLLPTPPLDPMLSPNSYDPTQGMVVNPAMVTQQPVPVVQHVAAPMDVSTPQYVTQGEALIPQEPSVAVLPVPGPPAQSYALWDSNQQAMAVQQQSQPQYSPVPSQAAIYYQGQACQAVYGVGAAYTQSAQPIVQSYAPPSLQYIPGQQIYAAHPQGVVVQQGPTVTAIVAPGPPQGLQQPEMGLAANNILDLPPPSPPKPKTIVLPPSWKTARDPEGKIYYYHVITRQTQWDPPSWDSPGDDMGSLEHESEMDLGTPTYDENPMKSSKKAKTAEADTSSELAKKSKEVFRKEMSQFIVQCLNPYRKPDCKIGRINTTEDFKHLARKLTHGVMNKELKYCKNPEDLDCNENVKHKTKEYIKKYMQKFGTIYKPKEDVDFE
ncbi:histone-lysine N-methyltransferase SETD2 isoform X3 [Ascaphus truei]|uniref:histone-lysine N-methyltransferase SETD2 isoform X3 n=1 Tax=Ascaphus truei TaxID=8439 RepID=UPI003F59172D